MLKTNPSVFTVAQSAHWHEVTDAHRVPATTCCAANDRRNAACDSDAVPDVRLGPRAPVGGTGAELLVEHR